MTYTENDRIRAKRRAMYILAQRDHSSKELYDKLIRNYPSELCELTVELMKEYGYIDEEKYAEKLYKECMTKGWGKSKIRYELRRRGLPEGLIARCEDNYDDEDFIDEIIELVNRKYAEKYDFSDFRDVQRLTVSLAGRGFSYDDIKTALARIRDNGDDYDDSFDD
ncbi:MAG: regulatory protein RecX [Ruminiclostridium sp.]|nr:regulatory protein RecX [Ruminiclostridium sp.]